MPRTGNTRDYCKVMSQMRSRELLHRNNLVNKCASARNFSALYFSLDWICFLCASVNILIRMDDIMEAAVTEVLSRAGKCETAREYGIPYSSLCDCVRNSFPETRRGGQTVFPQFEEESFPKLLRGFEAMNLPLTSCVGQSFPIVFLLFLVPVFGWTDLESDNCIKFRHIRTTFLPKIRFICVEVFLKIEVNQIGSTFHSCEPNGVPHWYL